jgi:hypothetical protein
VPVVRHSGDRPLFLAAAAAAFAATAVLLVAPLYSSGETLLEANGPEVLWAILVPLALALVPLAAPEGSRRRVGYAAGTVLLVMCFVSSAGVFFLLAAILLFVASARAPRPGGAA